MVVFIINIGTSLCITIAENLSISKLIGAHLGFWLWGAVTLNVRHIPPWTKKITELDNVFNRCYQRNMTSNMDDNLKTIMILTCGI